MVLRIDCPAKRKLISKGVIADNETDCLERHSPCVDGACSNIPNGQERITREVRHELVMLPYYGVFDKLNLQGGRIEGYFDRPGYPTDTEKRRRKRGEEYRGC